VPGDRKRAGQGRTWRYGKFYTIRRPTYTGVSWQRSLNEPAAPPPSDRGSTIKSEVPPREPAERERSELLMNFSRDELAALFVAEQRAGGMTRALRDEFNRRYWEAREEEASTSSPMHLLPCDVA